MLGVLFWRRCHLRIRARTEAFSERPSRYRDVAAGVARPARAPGCPLSEILRLRRFGTGAALGAVV